jgi:DNA mismatch endonuclease (patch repair protein)
VAHTAQDGASAAGPRPRKPRAAKGKPRDTAESRSATQAAAKGKSYPFTADPGRAANMRGNRRADTKPELALRAALHAMGYRYRKDFRLDLPLRRVRPDIAFTSRKVAVFVDGCFWHACPDHGSKPKNNDWYWSPKLAKNVERDRAADVALAQAGWTVVRLWEHVPLTDAVAAVTAAVGQPKAQRSPAAAAPADRNHTALTAPTARFRPHPPGSQPQPQRKQATARPRGGRFHAMPGRLGPARPGDLTRKFCSARKESSRGASFLYAGCGIYVLSGGRLAYPQVAGPALPAHSDRKTPQPRPQALRVKRRLPTATTGL